jgi:hypothetical protein
MVDRHERLKSCLGKLGLTPHREEEILRELSDHLDDHATALEARGTAGHAAAQEAMDCVSDWVEFRKQIIAAETEETSMNYRSKALWLPALCALFLSNILLALLQIFGPSPHLYWFYVVKSTGVFCEFVVPWLISLFAVGGIAAYWSRRAGGTLRYRLLAALAPAIALLGLFLLILPLAMIMDRHVPHSIKLNAFLVLTLTWVLLPAVPLLLGAVPFLRKPSAQA